MVYGFIGTGNMGAAIIRGMTGSGSFSEDTVCAYNRTKAKALALQDECGMKVLDSADSVAKASDVIVLCVKPQQMSGMIASCDIASFSGKLVISIAAGLPLSYYAALLPESRIIRAMPNLNAKYLCSVTGICFDEGLAAEDIFTAKAVFGSIGSVFEIQEHLFPAFSAVAGASPAFTFMYTDALAMAAVKAGIPRAQAFEIAAAAVKGSAVTLCESGEHPDALRDKVCSPGGTTIEGVSVLEDAAFKGIVMDAVEAVIEKDKKMAK
ncbi:MAG: pyrroline-5-carboxylate reductase [Oscillospiraceae bacterium]|nr:pyrroline-5-carboxylate reductase [Oscillospiraceae bacterium]